MSGETLQVTHELSLRFRPDSRFVPVVAMRGDDRVHGPREIRGHGCILYRQTGFLCGHFSDVLRQFAKGALIGQFPDKKEAQVGGRLNPRFLIEALDVTDLPAHN
jgi:hypothetical protein